MKKNDTSELIAQGMNTYLESPEFKFLFKKAELDLDSEVTGLDDDLGSTESLGDLGDTDMDLGLGSGSEDTSDLDEELSKLELDSATATDGLLTASAALDELGSPEASIALLKLASMVVEAKKKKMEDMKDKKKDKKKKEKEKEEKAKKDESDAKDKKMKKMKEKEKEEEKKEKEKAKKDKEKKAKK